MTGKPKSLVGQALHLRLPGALLCRQWSDALCKRALANPPLSRHGGFNPVADEFAEIAHSVTDAPSTAAGR